MINLPRIIIYRLLVIIEIITPTIKIKSAINTPLRLPADIILPPRIPPSAKPMGFIVKNKEFMNVQFSV